MVRDPPVRQSRWTGAAVAAAATAAALASAAHGQSASSTLSGYTGGYNTTAGALTQGVNVATRDLSGNKVIVDGVTRVGSDQSVFASSGTIGAVDAFSGVGATGQASAIANNLNVSVSGNYNTVIVNSTQTNNGNVSASTVLNGKVNLDGSN